MAVNIGQAVGNILPFDPTPNFQLSRNGGAIPGLGYDGAALASRNQPISTNSGTGLNTNNPFASLAASQRAGGGQVLGAQSGGGSAGGGASGAYSAPAESSAGSDRDVALYSDQLTGLQNLLKQTDIQRTNGENTINNSFGSAFTELNDSNNRTMQDYNTQRQDAQSAYSRTGEQINGNARNGFNSLQSLLGGTGSAGNVLAPFAVSQQANREKMGSADAFARNTRDVDTAANRAGQDFERKKLGLENEKRAGLERLLGQINESKMKYQQDINTTKNQLRIAQGGKYETPRAGNDIIAQLQAEQNSLSGRFAPAPIQAQTVDSKPVDLAQYQAQAAQLGGLNNQTDMNGTDDITAALQALLNKDTQNQQTTYAY